MAAPTLSSRKRAGQWGRRLFLFLVLAALLTWVGVRQLFHPTHTTDTATRLAQAYLGLEAREQNVAATTWKRELEAEAYENLWIRFWDDLNQTADPPSVLAGFFHGTPLLPRNQWVRTLRWNITQSRYTPQPVVGSTEFHDTWPSLLEQWKRGNWVLDRTEWHLIDHQPADSEKPPRSTFSFRLPMQHANPPERICADGQLEVEWESGDPPAAPLLIRITKLQVIRRPGPTAFQIAQVTRVDSEQSASSQFSDPLLALDLDGDGFTDFLTIGSRQCWRNEAHLPVNSIGTSRQFVPYPIQTIPTAPVWAAALADLSGDAVADLILASSNGLSLLPGRLPGGFDPGAPQLVWKAPLSLQHPQVLAVGDVDGDGQSDVWIGQYKLPYLGGQFPTPFDDANDGFPSFLLHNEGNGQLKDITTDSGLNSVRNRRAYSASFVDLANRGIPDWLQVSDFVGFDLFQNRGRGVFRDITDTLGMERHGFGMSHAIVDLNQDGLPDILMIGMNSPVAARLENLRLERPGSPATRARRNAMTVGNRLYLSQSNNPGTLKPVSGAGFEPLFQTGWSWGAAWADFGNDRHLQLVVAAGHDTQASTLDYERQFWLHDIDVASSSNHPVADFYFRSAAGRRQAAHASYGGWQHNSLVMEATPGDWVEVGWVMGLTFPADCRNLIVDDWDGDGRPDVVMLTEERWPVQQRRLVVFHNQLTTDGHWIGIRLDANQRVPLGARVILEDTEGIQTRWVLAGDGYRTQSAPVAHFGLGRGTAKRVTVVWPDGHRTVANQPQPDQWHSMRP